MSIPQSRIDMEKTRNKPISYVDLGQKTLPVLKPTRQKPADLNLVPMSSEATECLARIGMGVGGL